MLVVKLGLLDFIFPKHRFHAYFQSIGTVLAILRPFTVAIVV
jgi:hypothetical protein